MESLFDVLLKNPEKTSFTVLFIVLFVYTMRQNSLRESRYINTINTLTNSLKDLENIKKIVEKIDEKTGGK